jgi:NADH-quinone oxidoreductase subunit H
LWVDRKITARLQWRIGPPWHQNFMDILKLLGKEVIIPEGAKMTFLLAPFIGLLSLVLAGTILGRGMIYPSESFNGDLIVVFYFIVMPAIAMIIGASASRNPLASVGASREIKLILAYELPFLLAIITVIIKSGSSIQLGSILMHQAYVHSNLLSVSGLIAFIVSLFCVQAKLGFAPFDISEAEQEIMGGTLIEYSGLPLAVFKLTKAVLFYVLALFLITMFWAKDLNPIFLIGKFFVIIMIIILMKNTNPRLRIDQAVRFFWGKLTVLALIGLVLALFGL